MPEMSAPEVPRLSLSTILRRAMLLRCLPCGGAPLFTGMFSMHTSCSACGFHYEREPGYFLGAIYFGYGGLAVVSLIAGVVMQSVFDVPLAWIFGSLFVVAVLVATVGFRYSRAAWMALDMVCDPPKAEDYPQETGQ